MISVGCLETSKPASDLSSSFAKSNPLSINEVYLVSQLESEVLEARRFCLMHNNGTGGLVPRSHELLAQHHLARNAVNWR